MQRNRIITVAKIDEPIGEGAGLAGNMPITRLNVVLSSMIVGPKIYWRRNNTAVCTAGNVILRPCAQCIRLCKSQTIYFLFL